MRAAVLLALVLLGADAAADLRVAIVHDEPLLGSESKALADLQKRLGKRKLGTVTLGDATPAEASYKSGEKLPAEWSDGSTVIVLQVRPPRGKPPKRTSGGAGDLAVYRPPLAEPVYAERIEGEMVVIMTGEDLEKWIAGAVSLAGGAK
jgi:hypothetical protein